VAEGDPVEPPAQLHLPALAGAWVLVAVFLVDAPAYLDALAGLGSALASLDVVGAFERLKAFYPR